MALIINLVVGLIAFYFAYRFALNKQMVVTLPWDKRYEYVCNQNLSFLIYSILTALLFLGPLSLFKYVVWIVLLLSIIYRGGFRFRFNIVLGAYSLFVLWNLYTMTYTLYPGQGWMMLLKFCLPYLYFWLGYNAIQREDDFYIFLEKTCWICCVYALFLGGIISNTLPNIKALFTYRAGGLFISYASLADFFAILFSVFFIMYFVTKKRKYLWMAGWVFLSTVVDSVRTGIGASVLGLAFFYMIYKKGKSIPYIGLIALLFIMSIFAVPEVREKMFGEDADRVTLSNAGSAKVTMNGRDTAWKLTMEHFYKGRELKGSGCGSSLAWYKEYSKGGKGAGLIHSDWVQMLCESGNIGLGFYIVFALVMLLIVLSETWKYKDYLSITFAGALTVASFVACFFAMGFDNVITYAQQGYVIPFIFLGFFYKFKDMNNDFCNNTFI